VSRTILSDAVLKKRENGQSHQLTKFETEDERVSAIENVFGIQFTEEEKNAIKTSKLAVENLDPDAKSKF
jgi:hypothetical protein